MLHGCRPGLRQDFSTIDEWRCRDSLNCWAKKQNSAALSSWESELFAAITSGTRSLRIQTELKDLGHSCSVTVATDSQSVIDHSRRRGHSGASKHVGLRGLWLQEALVDGKLELAKVDTATNPPQRCLETESANCVGSLVCTFAAVKRSWVDDPNEWHLGRLDELC